MKGGELIREAKIPTVRRLVARRIAEMIEDKPEAVDALVALMTERADVRGDVLAGMAEGLDGLSQFLIHIRRCPRPSSCASRWSGGREQAKHE